MFVDGINTLEDLTRYAADLADLLQDVPQEVLDRLPTDGAAQHDHYIYGTPKRAL